MSQVQKIISGLTVNGIQSLSGDFGAPTGGDAGFNIKLTGGPGIYTISDPVTHQVQIGRTTFLTSTVITNDATPTTCISFDMGPFASVYTIDGKISARDVTDVAGGGYFFSASYRTDGAVGTLIGVNFGTNFEEAAMAASDFDILVTGNNIIVQVTGIVGKTIHWSAEFDFVLSL